MPTWTVLSGTCVFREKLHLFRYSIIVVLKKHTLSSECIYLTVYHKTQNQGPLQCIKIGVEPWTYQTNSTQCTYSRAVDIPNKHYTMYLQAVDIPNKHYTMYLQAVDIPNKQYTHQRSHVGCKAPSYHDYHKR